MDERRSESNVRGREDENLCVWMNVWRMGSEASGCASVLAWCNCVVYILYLNDNHEIRNYIIPITWGNSFY